MDTLKLSKPIMINGEEVKELTYDFEEMTAQDKLKAGQKYKKAGKVIQVEELDSDYHLYLFVEAVLKANPGMDSTDVLRISAKDSAKAEAKTRDFFFIDSEESYQTDISREQ